MALLPWLGPRLEAGQRRVVEGYAETPPTGGTAAALLRAGPGRRVLFLVHTSAQRIGGDRRGWVRWVVEPTGVQLRDGTPVATLEGVLPTSRLWSSTTALDAGRFAGRDSGMYPSLEEPLWSPVLTTPGSVLADRDGDGVADDVDAFPDDPAEAYDTDGDGTGDAADADDDNDGMPDAYERANGLFPRGDDGGLDLDGDGRSNGAEYQAGTAANDPSSWFRIERVEVPAAGRLRLEWQGFPGRRYSVLRLLPPPALPVVVESDITVAEPGPVARELDLRGSAAFLFLKVELISSP
jgi:hypothetical protein